MAPGFTFPPPPPPPPKASVDYATGANQYQPSDSRGGRGGRGRGRGRGGQQDRGHFQQRGHGGNFNQNYSNPNTINNAASVPYGQNLTSSQGPSYWDNRSQQAGPQTLSPPQKSFPSGAYINPAFLPQNGKYPYQDSRSQITPSVPSHQSGRSQSPDGFAGQKRKREPYGAGMPEGSWKQNQGSYQPKSAHPLKRVSMPKAEVPPAVPRFGASLPSPPKQSTPSSNSTKPKKKGGLGLVPGYDSPEESDDGDIDEEEAYTAPNNGPLTFEFNGSVSTLSSAADIKGWINERKRQFPTQRRIEEKEVERQNRIEERRRIERETRAAAGPELVSKMPQYQRNQPKSNKMQQTRQSNQTSELEQARSELEKQMKKVEELQRRLAENEQRGSQRLEQDSTSTALMKDESGIEPVVRSEEPSEVAPVDPASTNQTLLTDATDIKMEGSVKDEEHQPVTTLNGTAGIPNSLVNPDMESNVVSSASDTDDDSAPEVEESKAVAPIQAAPAMQGRKVCKMYSSSGRCRYGDRCYFAHVESDRPAPPTQRKRPEPAASQRKTLFQRLVEQEQDAENVLALQAIKYLGSVGFFRKADADDTSMS